MERKLIALAVSAAITATFAAGTASAAQKTVTIQGDKWDEPVVIYPTDASGSGFANIGELKVDVKDGIVIDSVTFKNTNPDSEKLRVGYLKHFGKKAVVNTLEIEAGTAERPTVATLQFWGKEKVETGKSFEGKKVVMRDMSAFRVANTTYFQGNYAGKSVKDSVFHADDVVTDGTAGLVFGVNADSAVKRSVGTFWAGYSDAADGKFTKAEKAVAGIAGARDYKSVQVGTVNVGNATFATIEDVTKLLPNPLTGLQSFYWSLTVKGAMLLSLDGKDTITFNLNHPDAKLALGTIGTVAVVNNKAESASPAPAAVEGASADKPAPVRSRRSLSDAAPAVQPRAAAAPAPAAEPAAPSAIPVNLSINVNVPDYKNEISVEKIESGAEIAISTAGSAEKSGSEVAADTAKLLKVAALSGGSEEKPAAVTTRVSVGQAGLNDAVETVYDVKPNAEGGGTTVDVGHGKTTVTSTNSVLGTLSEVASLGAMQWRAEMNHLQYRMGELRDQAGFGNGVWARAYQGKDKYGDQKVENEYLGFQAGYDHRLEGTNVILGGAVSFTHGDSKFRTGDGDNDALAFTAYGTWLHENGLFVDGTVKYAVLSNDVDMRAQNGDKVVRDKASYDTNAMSVSVEAGWRFPVTSLAYVEPQVELMYGHVRSADYRWDAYKVTAEGVDALVGRAGVMAGFSFPDKKGSVYMRASVLNDFKGEADTTFRYAGQKRVVSNDLGGSWYELGLGGNWNVTDSTYLYADFQYADGGEVDTPWRWSVGVRHAF